MARWIWILMVFFAPPAMAVSENDLNLCRDDIDCIIVPYSHCCGSTKRAINRRYKDAYEKHPEWQKFQDPGKCAVIGACLPDREMNKARCMGEKEKRCQLFLPEDFRPPCGIDSDCGKGEECRVESVACEKDPRSSHCVRRQCMPKK